MRCILGLARPQQGRTSIDGRPYVAHRRPLTIAGAVLDAKAFHPGRSARNHLAALATSNGIQKKRVGEVLELVGLSSVANKRAGSYSLGMGQRIGIAAALLGNPKALILDEPMNGLDPDGVYWLRELMRHCASEGKAVLISSHLLSEVALVADDLIVIGRGQVLANESMQGFMERNARSWVQVSGSDPEVLARVVVEAGGAIYPIGDGTLQVTGLERAHIGELAFRNNVMLTELVTHSQSLEQVFLQMTADAVEYRSPDRSSGNAS